MSSNNYYDVTEWKTGNPYDDIGEVINSIIADIKSRQINADMNEGGKPGAVIYIPPGDYHLLTQIVIDISYLKIMGSGHGFTSSSIRYNTPESDWPNWHEIWPGGSRILVDRLPEDGAAESTGAAFYIARSGDPRISSVEFADFCIDGLHFVDDGTGSNDPENSYLNGKTGIYISSAQDSFRINGMGMVYLEHGVTIYNADALAIHNNFIAECGNCIELRESGQASKITDNLIGAGYRGYSVYAENFGGLLITANNIFPRGKSSVHLSNVVRSSISSNRFHSFYPGMLIMENGCTENLVSSNHLFRECEPWGPMQAYDNGLDDLYGLLYISGDNNSIIANHISETIDKQYIMPTGATPVIIRVVSGKGNTVSNNHIVATTETSEVQAVANANECFSTQVSALLSTQGLETLTVTTVQIEAASQQNIVLDSGTDGQVMIDKTLNAFRATPAPGVTAEEHR
ncbi:MULTISPECIES: NosD domain-containing protein [Citrobacter]|uniref:Right-handed parallel beta-helix repeat-containing protein n=1 Tax=Citrobacter braakii TaxID=57706 RepID=A0A8I0G978_CITBR|nr:MULTISPECIES: NosD domain-containing protein [Citrobacter]MBD3125604.1 right-handed parallel beta-helix repeat-containing protein [Citrobacter braakii]MDM3386904.1 right-handed parallel beta-helix repeat-containing protein [Citrobacter sp. Cb011]MDM3419556.1 right-handed parallel beta-helix repeat-containing protein [Citrobacter sp. Cb025]MDM3439984.1 right-handed parallel beta-helix repeat-containing protein [Citrobacter sp. Cb063]WFY37918.1 right-handed parallel beta-helix repeat-containi